MYLVSIHCGLENLPWKPEFKLGRIKLPICFEKLTLLNEKQWRKKFRLSTADRETG